MIIMLKLRFLCVLIALVVSSRAWAASGAYIVSIEVSEESLVSSGNQLKDAIALAYLGRYHVFETKEINILTGKDFSECRETDCMTEIAIAVDLAFIIKASLSRDGQNLKAVIEQFKYNKRKKALAPPAKIETTFKPSNLNWISGEIVKKLNRSRHNIDPSRAPVTSDSKITLAETKKDAVKDLDDVVSSFESNDSAVAALLPALKKKVVSGDKSYAQGKFTNAAATYASAMALLKDLKRVQLRRLRKLTGALDTRVLYASIKSYEARIARADALAVKRNFQKAEEIYAKINEEIKTKDRSFKRRVRYTIAANVAHQDEVIRWIARLEKAKADELYYSYEFSQAVKTYDAALTVTARFNSKRDRANKSLVSELKSAKTTAEKANYNFVAKKVNARYRIVKHFERQKDKEMAETFLVSMLNVIEGGEFKNDRKFGRLVAEMKKKYPHIFDAQKSREKSGKCKDADYENKEVTCFGSPGLNEKGRKRRRATAINIASDAAIEIIGQGRVLKTKWDRFDNVQVRYKAYSY